MRSKIVLTLLCISLLLTGCGWTGKRYASVTPHQEQWQKNQGEAAYATNSLELIRVLEGMIRDGTENGVIYIAGYPSNRVESGMEVAVAYALNTYALGAYAVDNIAYEIGTTGSLPAMAVSITYRHSDAQIRQIREIVRMEEVEPLVAAALSDFDDRLVMRVEQYLDWDFQQMVRDYSRDYPETVMEVPQVTVNIYGIGPERVVELSFAYQTSRDSLRQMQGQVRRVFDAAELYVSGTGADRQKYSQLYAFLMERFDYQTETSITPAYSLLQHGVGDSRAFATVYAAMCRKAGLACLVVTGTRSGEPWAWNMIKLGSAYQHVDLLKCSADGGFRETADREMDGYVWDYSGYPECPVIYVPERTQEEAEDSPQPEETVPQGTEETLPETQPEELPSETEVTVPEETEAEESEIEKIEEI